MANELLKKTIKDARLKYYEVAIELNISGSTLYRMMQRELTTAQKEQILRAVNSLAEQRYLELKHA